MESGARPALCRSGISTTRGRWAVSFSGAMRSWHRAASFSVMIKEMFAKKIDREIQGVIIVGQGEDSNVSQELEEYAMVVVVIQRK